MIQNGQVVREESLRGREPDPWFSARVAVDIRPKRSGWVAARAVFRAPDGRLRQAHTSPVYFQRDGRRVREESSISYLCRYVEGLLHWLETEPPFVHEADRQKAHRDAEQALAAYQAL